MYGAMLAWFSIVATTMSEYLSSPPYNYDTSQIGLFNLPPFIGAVLGAVVGGPLNDRCILYIAKKHKGQFEPESRLWLALPAILLCPAGLLLYGLSLAHVSYSFFFLPCGKEENN
jgi:MFS family permease